MLYQTSSYCIFKNICVYFNVVSDLIVFSIKKYTHIFKCCVRLPHVLYSKVLRIFECCVRLPHVIFCAEPETVSTNERKR